MDSAAAPGPGVSPGRRRPLPAFGPLDAVLGYALLYVVVDRVTPTVVDALGGAAPFLGPSLVGLGLAAFLWFVLAVTALDQAQRQMRSLGLAGGGGEPARDGPPVAPSATLAAVYVVLLLAGGAMAGWAFEPAIAAIESLIRVVSALDVAAFRLAELLLVVLFSVSYKVATYSLDRLVVGGVRALLAR